MKREGEEQLPSPLYGFVAPSPNPLNIFSHTHTHIHMQRGREREGGLCMDRGRRDRQRGDVIRGTVFWSNNIVQSERRRPQHVFLMVTISYKSLILPGLYQVPLACLCERMPVLHSLRECVCVCVYMCVLGFPHICVDHSVSRPKVRSGETKGQGFSHACQWR